MDNREKILQTAEKLFARQGFDGARVDEIAKQAGVNKALIYYYFDSKEKILESILDRHMTEIFRQREVDIVELPELSKEDFVEAMLQKSLAMFEGREDFLKIVITEELKSTKKHWPLFQLIDESFQEGFKQMRRFGFTVKNEERLRYMAFFFGNIPLSMFMMLREEWGEYYDMDTDEMKELFIEGMRKTYIRYLVDELVE